MRADISLSHNYQTKQDAFRLFKDVDDFDFIVNLIMVYRVFDITLDATILLQSKKNDIADGLEVISSLINLVNQFIGEKLIPNMPNGMERLFPWLKSLTSQKKNCVRTNVRFTGHTNQLQLPVNTIRGL